MNQDKNASVLRVNAYRSVSTFSLLVIGIVTVAASVARTQETSDALLVNTEIANVSVGNLPQGVVVSPDNNSVYVANFLSNTVSVINAQTNTVENTISVGEAPYGLAISSDGNTLYVSQFTSPGAVTVIDLANENSTQTITGLSPYPLGIALSPDDTQLWIAAGNIDRIDTANSKVLPSVTVAGGCEALAFTPNGKKVYASGRDTGKISVVSTVTDKVTARIRIASPSNSEEFAGIAISGQKAYVLVDLGYNNLVGWLFTINTVAEKVVNKVDLSNEMGDRPALLPKTPYLYIPQYTPSVVTLFNTETKTLVGKGVTCADGP